MKEVGWRSPKILRSRQSCLLELAHQTLDFVILDFYQLLHFLDL
jgi:hypothetical protein